MNLFANMVENLRMESAWTPVIDIPSPFSNSGPSPVASAVGSFIKPAFTITLSGGARFRSAPYGEPGPSHWPVVQWTGAGVLFGVALLLLLRK